MAKLGKLDRMSIAEGALNEESMDDIKESINNAVASLEQFEDNRASAAEAFAEAQGYHEERLWEDRNMALETADGAVAEMDSALDDIEAMLDVIILPEGRMETMRTLVTDTQDHLSHLL